MRYISEFTLVTKTFDQNGNFIESGQATLVIDAAYGGRQSILIRDLTKTDRAYLPFGSFAGFDTSADSEEYGGYYNYQAGLGNKGFTYFIDGIEQDLAARPANLFLLGMTSPEFMWGDFLEFTYETGSDDGYTHTAFLVIDKFGDIEAALTSADPLTEFPSLEVTPLIMGGNYGERAFFTRSMPSFVSYHTLHVGTDGNDTKNGTPDNDEIHGLDGNDTFDGRAGDDLIYGDDGNDTLFGLDGRDTLLGGAGNDRLLGGNDNDSLIGADGDDYLHGGNGANYLNGGKGNDTLTSSGSSDTMLGQDGNDVLTLSYGGVAKGGTGHDELSALEGSNRMYGNGGNDRLEGARHSDLLAGGAGRDTLTGGDGNDTLKGNGGNDKLYGGDGHDILYGGAGNDILIGQHRDRADYPEWNPSPGNDTMIGGTGADVFVYTGGKDVIADLKGNDTLVLAQDLFLVKPLSSQTALLKYAVEVEDDLLLVFSDKQRDGSFVQDNNSLLIMNYSIEEFSTMTNLELSWPA